MSDLIAFKIDAFVSGSRLGKIMSSNVTLFSSNNNNIEERSGNNTLINKSYLNSSLGKLRISIMVCGFKF